MAQMRGACVLTLECTAHGSHRVALEPQQRCEGFLLNRSDVLATLWNLGWDVANRGR